MLEVRNLSIKLGHNEILKDVSFSCHEGKIIALLGRNGSGKTTLLRALASDLLTKQGSILVDGKLHSDMSSIEYASNFAFLPQTLNKPAITVEQLIAFGCYNETENVTYLNKEQQNRLDEVLENLNLTEFRNNLVCHLSSGQRQLVYFALMLVKNAKYNLMDEPVSNLDVEVKKMVFSHLQKMKEENKTVLISLHDINESLSLADEVVVLEKGKLIYSGKTGDFIESGLIEQLFHLNKHVLRDEFDNIFVLYR